MKKSLTLLFIAAITIFLTYNVSAFFSFFIFIPVFYFLEKDKIKGYIRIILVYIFFLIFNIIPTYWLANVQLSEGLMTWSVNSILMLMVALLTLAATKAGNTNNRLIQFISLWLVFEYFHHIWVFNWPWLSLGNIFCTNVKYVQWYKYTGMGGGTLWILLINLFIYKIFQNRQQWGYKLPGLGIIIFFPIALSLFLFHKEKTITKETYPLIITQPNANTLKNKVNELALIDNIFDNISSLNIKKPSILLLPETFIKENVFDNRLKDCIAIQKINQKLIKCNGISCITGLIMNTANTASGNDINSSINTYDAAIFLDATGNSQVHFKSKLIPIEEYLPKPLAGFGLLSDNFSLGNDYNAFKINKDVDLSVGICYEIIFGQSIAEMVSKNTGAILMIANEQMLAGNTEKEFYTNICRLRAIENGKYLAKSSNTGFSGLINEKGETVFKLQDGKFGLASIDVPIHRDKTFYTKYYQQITLFVFLQGIIILLSSIYLKLRTGKIDILAQ